MSTLDEFTVELRKAVKRPQTVDWALICERLAAWPEAGLTDEELNKRWFLQELARAIARYVSAFRSMKERRFYEAWCTLEQAEIALGFLARNPFYDLNQYRVAEWLSLIASWQTTFPYKVFFSPGMKVLRAECSICREPEHIDSFCGHATGKVYAGKLCGRVIVEAEMREISVVLKPVQKYSVAFSGTDDPAKYGLVEGIVRMLPGPFDRWQLRWTTRLHPHELFADIEPTASCPCGGSSTYDVCCGPKAGVVRPHVDILLDQQPTGGIPPPQLVGYQAHQLKRLNKAHLAAASG